MANFHSLPLFTFILISRTAAATATDLATKVCRSTTNYAFCQAAVYADPRAAGADEYFLSYIIFRQAYTNATSTRDFIASKVKSMEGSGQGSGPLTGLRKCLDYYGAAIRRLREIQGNLDSDTYSGLDTLSIEVQGSVRACEASVGERSVLLSKRNQDMIKLSNICLAVSKLYAYT